MQRETWNRQLETVVPDGEMHFTTNGFVIGFSGERRERRRP